jgi:hypothetical protein
MNGENNKWKHAQIKNDKSNNLIFSKKHYLREAKKQGIKAWQINNTWFQEIMTLIESEEHPHT